MAVRQYIGARYVPKFFDNPDGSNEWLEGIAYEALTVVTYAGNSFTSKIPVPANVGSPNLNQKYWVNTGTGGGGDLNALQTQVNKNTDNISDINSKLNDFAIEKKKYIFLSDSYGVTDYPSTSGKTMMNLIAEYMGLSSDDFYQFPKGSCGFSRSDNNFNILLQENIANVANPEDITDIIVFGGANDQNNIVGNNVENSIKSFVDYCNTVCPNAKIGLACNSKTFKQNMYNVHDLVKQYQKISKFGGYYINGSEYIMHKLSQFRDDQVHPTPSSVDYLSMHLANGILTKNIDIYDELPLNLEVTSTDTWTTTYGLTSILPPYVGKLMYHNGIISFRTRQTAIITINAETPITFNGRAIRGGFINCNDSFFNAPTNDILYSFNGYAQMYNESNEYYTVPIAVYFSGVTDNKMYLGIIFNAATGTTFNAKSITIQCSGAVSQF